MNTNNTSILEFFFQKIHTFSDYLYQMVEKFQLPIMQDLTLGQNA
jgi:hypothetical protein